MNTSKLQAFATDARRQLMNAVQARLDAALVPNSDAQVDDPRAFDFLQHEIERAGGGEEGRRHWWNVMRTDGSTASSRSVTWMCTGSPARRWSLQPV